MASEELEFVNDLLGSFSLDGLTVAEQRQVMEQSASAPLTGTTIAPVDADGVPAEWVVAPGADSEDVLVSLHGGAYSIGSLATNRWFSSLLSDATRRRVLSIDYRLAPEHPFPAAVDDTVATYRWLLDSGVLAKRIAVAGNSAGGGLALATLVALRDQDVALPVAAIALSAWTDLTASGSSVTTCAATDLMLTADGLRYSADLYAGPSRFDHPYASPLFADLHGLPRPPRLTRDEARRQLSPMTLSFMGESRRLSNRRMKRELRLRLRHPTLREGLPPPRPAAR